jgi:RNA polymerase sigma-70 factor, ECF subfamily
MEVKAVYRLFHESLLRYIRSKVRSGDDAKDILQDVFIKISNNLETLADDQKLRHWIFTITKNAITDYYRRSARQLKTSLDSAIVDEWPAEDTVDTTQGLDHCIGSMIALLPNDYKDIIVDAEINGLKQKDLAVKYEMAYPTMRSRVQRGRERLKQLLHNCCHIETDVRGNIISAEIKGGCDSPCNTCSE